MQFFKKLLSNEPEIENICIQRLIPKCKKWKIDTLYISTSRNCSCCKQYNGKIYSLYGWNKKYEKLPDLLLLQKYPECGHSIGASLHQPGINSTSKK